MSKKQFNQISAATQNEDAVTSLAIRPNAVSSYGRGNLSGKELQAWFDKLALTAIRYYNEMASVLSSPAALDYISPPSEIKVETLSDLLKNLLDANGNLKIKSPISGKNDSLDSVLAGLLFYISRLEAFTEINSNSGTRLSSIYATIARFLS